MKINEEQVILSTNEESLPTQNNNQIESTNNLGNNNTQIPNNNENNNSNKKFYLRIPGNQNFHGMHPHQGMHQHQHHQHDFSNPKVLFYFVLGYIVYINYYIQNTFSNFTSSLDSSLVNSNMNKYIKGYIHSKQIFLIIYIFNIQYLLSMVDKITFLNFLNQNTKSFMFLSIIILYVHYYFFRHKLFLEKDEELEKFIIKRNPQIKRGKCEQCDLLRVMRSYHCIFCGKCIKKYQLHSDWFNICIGVNNELLYSIAVFFTIFYFFVSNLIFWYYIFFRYDLLKYVIFIFIIFAIVGSYITFISGKFLYTYIIKCLFNNLTFHEQTNMRNYIYLSRTGHGIFNPFNKGVQRNLEEMLINMFDIDIYSDYKNYNCQNLSEIIDDNNNENTNNIEEDSFDPFNNIAGYKYIIKLAEHVDPLITSKGNIYKFVDGKEIINWNRLMIFTVFDIINSPYKDAMVKEAKFFIGRYEAFNKSKENQNINAQKEDEKIDEQEKKEENKEEIKEEKEEKENENENEEHNLIKEEKNDINNPTN